MKGRIYMINEVKKVKMSGSYISGMEKDKEWALEGTGR
jgi:hypothetical protein